MADDNDTDFPTDVEEPFTEAAGPEAPEAEALPDEPGPSGGGSISGVKDLFKKSFSAYKGRVVPLTLGTIVAFLLYVVPFAAVMVLGYFISTMLAGLEAPVMAASLLIGVTVAIIGFAWGYSVIYILAIDDGLGIKDAFKDAKGKILGFAWVFTLLGLVVMGSLVLLVIPGFVALVLLLLAPYAFFDEDERGMAALLKSREYVRGHGIAVFLRVLALGLFVILLAAAISILSTLAPILGLPLNLAMNLFIVPFSILFYYKIFEDLRSVKGPIKVSVTKKAKAVLTALCVIGLAAILLPFGAMAYKMGPQMIMMGSMMTGQMQGSFSEEVPEEFLEQMTEDFNAEGFEAMEDVVVEHPSKKTSVKAPPSQRQKKSIGANDTAKNNTARKDKAAMSAKEKAPITKKAVYRDDTEKGLSGRPLSARSQMIGAYSGWGAPEDPAKDLATVQDTSKSWIERNDAIRRLGQARYKAALDVLIDILANDPEPFNRREAAIALGKIGDKKATSALNAALSDDDEWVRKYADQALMVLSGESTLPKTRPAAGKWVVHAASYTTLGEAEELSRSLQADGYNAYITEFDHRGKHWFRVRVGFYSTKAEAEKVKSRIVSAHGTVDAWLARPPKAEVKSYSE